jgi:hypothetical protein
MSGMELNPRRTSLPIGDRHIEREWDDDDPTMPEVPNDIAKDAAMRALLDARLGLAFVALDGDLCRWVLTFVPDESFGDEWATQLLAARHRVKVLRALGVGLGHVPIEPGRRYDPPTSDRMVLDRAIDWLHSELLAGQ